MRPLTHCCALCCSSAAAAAAAAAAALSGGIIYGWPGLAQQLKDDYEFVNDCDPGYTPEVTCPSQDQKLSTIFTVGANIATVSTIVYGFTLDRFGPRANAFSGAMLMAAGFLLLGYSESTSFNAFIPGFSLIAFGGLGTYLPAFQFSTLFSRPNRILALQAALFGLSGLTFTFMKFLSEDHGISRKTSMVSYAILVGLCGLSMLALYPAKAYKAGDIIHLPILGWLGIEEPPAPHVEGSTSENSVVAKAVINGNGDRHANGTGTEHTTGAQGAVHDGSIVLDGLKKSSKTKSKGHGSDYAALNDNDKDASAENSRDGESPTNGMASYGSDLESPPVVGTGTTIPSGSLLALVPTEAELAHLRSQKLVRDLTEDERTILKRSRSLKDELLNWGTILVALFFAVGLLCCNMYNANISSLLKKMGDRSGDFANAFVFISSIYPCFFSLTIDELQRRYRYAGTSAMSITCNMSDTHRGTQQSSHRTEEADEAAASERCCACNVGIAPLCILLNLCCCCSVWLRSCLCLLSIGIAFLFINNKYAQLGGFFVIATGRALLITVMFSFVNMEYRPEHIGRVIAFVTTIAAAIGLLQLELQALLNGPADDDFNYFTTGMIVAMVPLFSFSWWCHKNRT